MKLDQVTLPVHDLARAVAFYTRFGLLQIVDAPPRYARFELPDGDATLSLELSSQPVGHGPELFFELPSAAALDAKARELEALGFRFDHGPIDQSWLWREARLRDPDGNRLCLFYAGENRRNPPWRMGGT